MEEIKEFLDKYNIEYKSNDESITGHKFMIYIKNDIINSISGITGSNNIISNDVEFILSKLFPIEYRDSVINQILK